MSDYIDRTIETIRNHDPDANWWVGAAHALSDEIERLYAERAEIAAEERAACEKYCPPLGCGVTGTSPRPLTDVERDFLARGDDVIQEARRFVKVMAGEMRALDRALKRYGEAEALMHKERGAA